MYRQKGGGGARLPRSLCGFQPESSRISWGGGGNGDIQKANTIKITASPSLMLLKEYVSSPTKVV